MMSLKILVIEATASAGSHFVAEALRAGHELWALAVHLSWILFFFHTKVC